MRRGLSLPPSLSRGRGPQSFRAAHSVRCCLPIMEAACGLSRCTLLLPGELCFGDVFQPPPLDLIHQGGDCIWEGCPPPPPALQLCEARSDPRGARLIKIAEVLPEAAAWRAVGAMPRHAACAMPRIGYRGSFTAAQGCITAPLPPAPHEFPLQPVPAVRAGCISLLSNQQLPFSPRSSASVP